MKESYFLKKQIGNLKNEQLAQECYYQLAGNCIRNYFYAPNASEEFVRNYIELIELLLTIEAEDCENAAPAIALA